MSQYRLRVSAEISDLDPYGYNGPGFRMQEDVSFEADGFLKIAAILGEFHSLSERLKKAEDQA